MTARPELYKTTLDAAKTAAEQYLHSIPDRPVPPRNTAQQLRAAFDHRLPDGPTDPAEVVSQLNALVEPGLMAIASGRFFGWVMGGTLPAALGADWLVSAWDQNAGLHAATPGVVAAEDAAGRWLLDVLGLPSTAAVGFVTGATMANFTGLAAARDRVLAQAGWDVAEKGLTGSPAVRVIVGEQRHESVDVALRYLGLGAPQAVAADRQGRLVVASLNSALESAQSGPTIVCLQAGNVHSGAFDPIAEAIEVAHQHGAWVHIDGAFGLWAGASVGHRQLVTGYEAADSWTTDAHKTLNVPYDCGITIVADRSALRSAMGIHASYLIPDAAGDPLDLVPEMSRRARGVPVWAALRSLGRSGVAALVDDLAHHAQEFARAVNEIDEVEVLNDVVYTQVCLAVGDDERTRAVIAALLAEGVAWMSGSRWGGRAIIRVSVSNWSTDARDIEMSVQAIARAVAATAP
ncbi:aminotransferase class V-fold PLP-dependent enzyme [Jatrophihabitans telluris]|uniref:Aminotransferase class V-fold PLP-dependent enzyme n=1 Tax=Jatrophihabitans telluris TaxID=2038343 RepID=A0ABY4R0T8_9ACTN|nr:aminotransferase class V-fold PLP-dependent enzyme [Jatrophihabitans telluris]UQX89132.1 aminotransferase class V-fold PLP-dependent enzyme [Jatrophihabitans telluris]